MTDTMKETDSEVLERMGTDAAKWAEEFNKTAQRLGYSQMDEGWLIGWFANAIEYAKGHAERDTAIKAALELASERWFELPTGKYQLRPEHKATIRSISVRDVVAKMDANKTRKL